MAGDEFSRAYSDEGKGRFEIEIIYEMERHKLCQKRIRRKTKRLLQMILRKGNLLSCAENIEEIYGDCQSGLGEER